MGATAMQNALVKLLVDNPTLLVGLDLLTKSIIVLLLTLIVSRFVRNKLFSVNSLHILWMIGISCLALIPLASIMTHISDTGPNFSNAVLTLSAPASAAAEPLTSLSTSFSSSYLTLLLYLLPCLFLLVRMLFAVISVIGIGKRALPAPDNYTASISKDVAIKLGLSRPVRILCSAEITSPFSFGIFHPKVILPEQAKDWSKSTLEDVLVHELSHIKRHDWLSTLFCHFIASLYWINPLCWIAINRISEEAEHSCDAAVLEFGKNGADYARNLLQIARRSRDGHRLLTQMMADKRVLPKRVKRILENKIDTSISKKSLQLATTLAVALLVTFGNTQLIAVEAQLRPESYFLEDIKPASTFAAVPRFAPF